MVADESSFRPDESIAHQLLNLAALQDVERLEREAEPSLAVAVASRWLQIGAEIQVLWEPDEPIQAEPPPSPLSPTPELQRPNFSSEPTETGGRGGASCTWRICTSRSSS